MALETYGQIVFDKATRTIQWRKNSFISVNGVGKLDIHRPKSKVRTSVTCYGKSTLSGLIIHVRIKIATVDF